MMEEVETLPEGPAANSFGLKLKKQICFLVLLCQHRPVLLENRLLSQFNGIFYFSTKKCIMTGCIVRAEWSLSYVVNGFCSGSYHMHLGAHMIMFLLTKVHH